MFNSSSDGSRSFSLANIIEEQLSNISLGNPSGLVLEEEDEEENVNDELLEEEHESLEANTSDTSSGSGASGGRVRSQSHPGTSRDEAGGSSDHAPPSDKIVAALDATEVRWFYKEKECKRWRAFNGHDTLSIEAAFRTLPKDLIEEPQREPPKKFEGTLYHYERSRSVSIAAGTPSRITPSRQTPPEYKVLVLGGLYEVDLVDRNCRSIYWPGETYMITRGSWFYESWQPVCQEASREVEKIHLELFLGKRNSDFPVDNSSKSLKTQSFPDFNIDWYSPNEVYLYSKAASSKLVRTFAQKLGYFKKSTGNKLIRGYKSIAKDDDKQKDITHLVFVVHGIGQKMNAGPQIFSNTISMRERVSYLQAKYFPDCNERVEFFPVEWRNNLVLDDGTVDAITPMHIKYLRQILNTSAMDVMYYTSPLYCAEIQEGLVVEMNRLWSMFLERNPHVMPKVSIVAHSLGCVITYDIVTGWVPMGTNSPEQENILIPGKSRLNFSLDNFFCLGSPLAVFLALRVPKGQHGYHLFPPSLCNRLYNIYHLTDPVAYRLEPLIARDYTKIAPLPLHPYNAANPIPYSEMNLEVEGPDVSHIMATEGSTSPADTPMKDKSWSFWNLVKGKPSESGGSPHHLDSPIAAAYYTRDTANRKVLHVCSSQRYPGGLEHRLDYVLSSGAVGPLVVRSVLISHTAYWNNNDVAFFILTRIFPELEIQRSSLEKSGRIKRYREVRRDRRRVKKIIRKHRRHK